MVPYLLAYKRVPHTSSWAYLLHILRERPDFTLLYKILCCCAHRTGERRLRLPEPLPPYEGLYYVQKFGKSCPQQRLVLPNGLDSQLVGNINNVVTKLYGDLTPEDEDCKGNAVLTSVVS